MINFKGNQFEREIILWGVRWYVAYPISYRQLEEMMGERGVTVDHSTLNRWVIKYAPEVEKQFRRRQRPVGRSWRLDETYVKIKGKSAYLYRAVDKEGQPLIFSSPQIEIAALPKPSYVKRFGTRGSQRRSRSTRVAAIRQRLRTTTRLTRPPLLCATPSISIMLWSRTIER